MISGLFLPAIKKRAMRWRILSICLLILVNLPACTTTPGTVPPPTMPSILLPTLTPERDSPTPTSTSLPPPSLVPTLTPTAAILPMNAFMFTTPTPGIRAADAELLFPAPIPSADEIMEWRPPPVPVPHSLHPNDHYWLRRPIPSGRVDWGLDWYPYGGNGGGQWRVHHGMDFPNHPGTPVLAAGDGVVILTRDSWKPANTLIKELEDNGLIEDTPTPSLTPESEITLTPSLTPETVITPTQILAGAYGNYVIIRHDWGWEGQPVYTLYAHLLEIFVNVGDHVMAGDLIAGVGNTGDSTGPHLHLEVRIGKNNYSSTRNPALWIAPYEEWGTLAGMVTDLDGTYLQNVVLSITPVDGDGTADTNDYQTRYTTSYASDQVNPDDHWKENFCFPDLPPGNYRVMCDIGKETLEANVEIRPGVTSMLKLHSRIKVTETPPPPETSSTPTDE